MSRAFTKEADGDSAIEDLPDLPISDDANIVTHRGQKLIEERIAELQSEAVSAGDDRATAARIARDLRYWTVRRASAELAPVQDDVSEVRFGHLVTLERDGKALTFRIVGQDEADPNTGLLSYISPLAQALMGSEIGDVVTFGPAKAKILAIAV